MAFREIQLTNVATSVAELDDPLLRMNAAETGTNASDVGFVFERGSLTNVALMWDESADEFALISTSETGSTNGNVTISSYSNLQVATLTGNVTGNVTGNLTGNITGTVSDISNFTTANLSENTNLYYTDARARSAISASGDLSYNSGTGVMSYTFTQGNTDTVSEGSSNLYYTDARARSAISASGDLTYNSGSGVISFTSNKIGNLSEDTTPQLGGSLDLNSNTINGTGTIAYTGNMTLTDASAGSSAGPIIELYRNNASPANANYLGDIKFQGKNSSGSQKNYAKITGKIANVTAGAEDGTIELAVMNNGSNDIVARINENGLFLTEGHTLKFEGATNDTAQTTLTVADPTADRTITLPDSTGTVALTSDIPTNNNQLSNGAGYITGFTETFTSLVQDTSPQLGGALDVNGHSISFGDNEKARFGNADDLEIYYDGTDGYIRNHVGGQIITRARTNLLLQTNATGGGADTAIQALQNGAVELYWDNDKKFETTTNGIDVTGVGSNFKSASYNILNLQTDTDDNGSSDDGIFKITNGSSGTTKAELRWDESEGLVHISSSDHGRHISINSSGYVGIGTGSTTPSEKLVVKGDGARITVESDDMEVAMLGRAGSSGSALDQGYLRLRNQGVTADGVVINSAGDSWLNGGNVGIGTDSPGFKLQVDHGTAAQYASSIRNTADNLQLLLGTTTGGLLNIQGKTISSNAVYQIALQAEGGNVGIGTTNPGSTLSVSGPASLANLGGGSTGSAALYVNSTSEHVGELIQVLRNGTTKMHMANDGKLGIGTASPSRTLHVNGGSEANLHLTSDSGRSGIFIDKPGTTSVMGSVLVLQSDESYRLGTASNYHVQMFQDGVTQIMGGGALGISVDTSGNVGIGNSGPAAKLHVTGGIYATGDVTAYYSSDINLKENVVDIENALDKVKQIRGVRYDWKDEYLEEHTYVEKQDVGVIAQEVEKVLPEIVAEREDGTKAVKYDRLTALLIEAVKELSAKVDAQQEEINILKGK